MADQRMYTLLKVICRRIKGAEIVDGKNGSALVVVSRGDHPAGKHSIVWRNYPLSSPLGLVVFSHYNDFNAPAEDRRQYHAKSVEELVTIIETIYSTDPFQYSGSEFIKLTLRKMFADSCASPREQVAELIADIMEYCDGNNLDFESISSEASQQFITE